MQERLISAAATTSMFLRKGISETKDKMAVGKTKVEEVIAKEVINVGSTFIYSLVNIVDYLVVLVLLHLTGL